MQKHTGLSFFLNHPIVIVMQELCHLLIK